MSGEVTTEPMIRVRDLEAADLDDLVRIDARHTGEAKPDYWRGVLREFVERREPERIQVGLAATEGGRLIGYVLGEVRAFEFGSPPCGWIFAVGVEPGTSRRGVGSALLGEACARLRESGVERVRTMVLRNQVDVLSFFRANGFEGGSFVQLELDIDSQEER